LRKPKFTLGELGIEAMFAKLGKSEAKMFLMFFVGFGIDENVVEIDKHEFVEILHENRVHETRESSWSIGETKGHDGILVKTITSSESSLWNILLADFYLVITASQV
jgi:hypothetical protein